MQDGRPKPSLTRQRGGTSEPDLSRMPAPAHLVTPSNGWRTPNQGCAASEASCSRAFSSFAPSVCGSECGSAFSSPKKRPGTGRFHSDELLAFKRLPTPSPLYSRKLEVYNSSGVNQLRKAHSESGLHTLPAMRGEFYRYDPENYMPKEIKEVQRADLTHEEKNPRLPMEEKVTHVLEMIFPRKLHSREGLDISDRPEKTRSTKRKASDKVSPDSLEQSASSSKLASSRRDGDGGEAKKVGGFDPQESMMKGRKKHEMSPMNAQRRLIQFRQKMLDRFSTMRAAFELFTVETQSKNGELSKKDFSRFLSRHFGAIPKEEHDRIFDFLDHNKNGSLSLEEFHEAIESASPVRNIEDLRRKWVSLGYPSMRHALLSMDLYKEPGKQYTVAEFGALLSKVGVEEDGEHHVIFNAIQDPATGRNTVTLEQLAAAVSAVSPGLLLEDFRDKLFKRYGNANAAYSALDIDQSDKLEIGEFLRIGVMAFKLTNHEAAKAFRLIDIDNSHKVSRREFVTAINLSEPNLFLEELRRKVRQRFRSIKEAMDNEKEQEQQQRQMASQMNLSMGSSSGFGRASPTSSPSHSKMPPGDGSPTSEPRNELRLRQEIDRQNVEAMGGVLQGFKQTEEHNQEQLGHAPEDYHNMLGTVQMNQSEVKALLDMVDFDKDGEVTYFEFERGIRMFSPSCVVEDLRLSCLRVYGSVEEAFSSVSADKRDVPMNFAQFKKLLEDLGLVSASVNVQAVFDICEVARDGGLSISELVSALSAVAAGTQARLLPEQRDARAKQQVKYQMAPFHRSASELRSCVREKLHQDEKHALERPASWMDLALKVPQGPGGTPERKSRRTQMPLPVDGFDPNDPNSGRPKSQSKEEGTSRFVLLDSKLDSSYAKVSKYLTPLPEDESSPILGKLQGYYSAGDASSSQDQILAATHSRFGMYSSCQHHYQVLAVPLMGPKEKKESK
eukprot:TRINITY_DN6827_c1_g1_i1.p1 TRINITY_DN6827_c1_g1~~TRINITY_DN6827_c1_g1_i1.p1  ORF type:complete len:954 (-),score=154.67 TRINITY_DN6827_c1_g1_i1:128-2989(-)